MTDPLDAMIRNEERLRGVIDILHKRLKKARADHERLQRSHARYEYVRCLNPRQFIELWQSNMNGEAGFDDLVDRRIADEIAALAKRNDDAG